MNRLQRFRQFVGRMDPTASPLLALREGLVLQPPGQRLADDLATRLELEPASQHLVLGTVGSGKSTAVLQAVDRLRASTAEAGDHVVYLDVSRRHRLDDADLYGVLVALAGLDLGKRATERLDRGDTSGRSDPPDAAEVRKAAENFKSWALGHTKWVSAYDGSIDKEGDDELPTDRDESFQALISIPGRLRPPQTPLPPALASQMDNLFTLSDDHSRFGTNAIYAFDSLDRLTSPSRFQEAVKHDIRALRAAEIGSIVVGPVRFALGHDTTIRDLFDHVHVVAPPDPRTAEGEAFCVAVLQRRDDSEILPANFRSSLAQASGGILRDLLGLAKRSAEEAYAMGRDTIGDSDVQTAVRSLGESLAFGMDDEDVRVLRHLDAGKGFVIRGERELALVEQRRIVPVRSGEWRVHPALQPILQGIPKAA